MMKIPLNIYGIRSLCSPRQSFSSKVFSPLTASAAASLANTNTYCLSTSTSIRFGKEKNVATFFVLTTRKMSAATVKNDISDNNTDSHSNKMKVDYDNFLCSLAKRRKPSAIRSLQPLVSLPGMISLGGGMPNPSLFPFQSLDLRLKDGTVLQCTEDEVKLALQYSPTPGLPELCQRIKTMLIHEHLQISFSNSNQKTEHHEWEETMKEKHSRRERLEVAIVPGSQDGLAKIFDMLLEERDTLLIESPTYSGSLAALEAKGCNLIGIETDELGLNPEALRRTLANWEKDENTKGKSMPKALYTIPTGSNPTGASMTFKRKQEVYAICREFNLLIIEDDPYYYMQYQDKNTDIKNQGNYLNRGRTHSFLSIDIDERVIRTDSFSKILSSGMRVGVVSGPPELLGKLNLHNQASIMHTSGLSQLAVLRLLQYWGVGDKLYNDITSEEGSVDKKDTKNENNCVIYPMWEDHLECINNFYYNQCKVFMAAAGKHLKSTKDGLPLAEYNAPSAGMFVWMKLKGIEDSSSLILKEAVSKKVLLVPGASFFPNNPKTSYVRAAFSVASEEQINIAMERLGAMLREKNGE